jgi:hypothetical protein
MTTQRPPDEREARERPVLAALVNAAILILLFILSRFVRAMWSETAGDVSYWLLACYLWGLLAAWRVDLFRWIRNPDTSFVLNMIVRAAASFAIITGLRIATAPLIVEIVKRVS